MNVCSLKKHLPFIWTFSVQLLPLPSSLAQFVIFDVHSVIDSFFSSRIVRVKDIYLSMRLFRLLYMWVYAVYLIGSIRFAGWKQHNLLHFPITRFESVSWTMKYNSVRVPEHNFRLLFLRCESERAGLLDIFFFAIQWNANNFWKFVSSMQMSSVILDSFAYRTMENSI